MARRALVPCRAAGCGMAAGRGGWCQEHRPAQRRRVEQDAARGTAHERGYTSRWRAASRAHLEEHPWCVKCGAPAAHVDHIMPHKGDARLFWSSVNWQGLCQACHTKKTWEERRMSGEASRVVVVAGPPCGGKTTWVAKQRRPGDLVVDLDALVGALTLGDWYGDSRPGVLGLALRLLDVLLGAVRTGQHDGTAWVVTAAAYSEAIELSDSLKAVFVLKMPTKEEALRRAQSDKRRGTSANWQGIVSAWYYDYQKHFSCHNFQDREGGVLGHPSPLETAAHSLLGAGAKVRGGGGRGFEGAGGGVEG